jgi:peptidoglycan/LPS O-acetylase OafA/YrhL
MSNTTNPINRSDVSAWYANTNHFECLNGLRAISIIAVVWHHTASSESHFLKLLGYGYHGVTFFFLISGFLITTLLLKERDRTGKIDLFAFFVRRSLRIFPLYYAVLLAYVVLVFLQERNTEVGAAFFSNLKYFATYTSNIFVPLDGRVIFYFAWSLAAEEQFYLVLAPLLAALSPKRAALSVTVISIGLVLCNILSVGNPATIGKVAPLGIWLGTLAAFLLRDHRSEKCLRWLFGMAWSAPLLAVTTLLILESSLGGEAAFVTSAAAMLIACLISSNQSLAAALNNRLLVHIGKVSYGIYLMHMICKAVVTKIISSIGINAPNEINFLLVLFVALLVATLSFNTFERQFLKRKIKFIR